MDDPHPSRLARGGAGGNDLRFFGFRKEVGRREAESGLTPLFHAPPRSRCAGRNRGRGGRSAP